MAEEVPRSVCAQESSEERQARATRQQDLSRHLTKELLTKVHRFASRRCYTLRCLGVVLVSDHHKQVVADVIADTAIARLNWSPDRCALSTHICQAVISRTHKEMLRQRRFQHYAPNDENEWEEAINDTVEPIDTTYLRHETLETLLTHLEQTFSHRKDPAALAIIAAWRAGITKRRDVAVKASLSLVAYDNARARVVRHMATACAPMQYSVGD